MRPLYRSALLALACAACEGAPPTQDGGVACTSDADCPGMLVCTEGVCQVEGCDPGAEGCMCAAGDRCGRGSDGRPLVCHDGVCGSMSCPAGETTCACIDGIGCTDEGDVCQGNRCVSADCEAGAEGCPCLLGGCDAGLQCLEGSLCVDSEGYEGGACLPNGRCHRGARCDAALGVCAYCDLGTEGCGCGATGGCNAGLACLADVCVSARSIPPTDPVCYTPCREPLPTAEGTRACEADGLMRGCIADQECTEGSCLAPGETKPACASDLDCPFFQTCLSGGCYSNCENSVDCPPGLGCHERVCRVPCESVSGGESCGPGLHCDAPDGENGYCRTLPDPDPGGGTTAEPERAAFTLDQSVLELSNVATRGRFRVQIAEDDGLLRRFTVRKLRHTLTLADGTNETVEAPRDPMSGEWLACDAARGECPLWWLEMGDAGSRAPTLDIEGVAGCEDDECPEVGLANAAGVTAVRWEGELEVTSSRGRATLLLTYVERPEGRWSGTMHYFGSFPDTGVDAWQAQADRGDARAVKNGLILRWAAFRQGSLPGGWDELKAVLEATRTESWRFPNVAERCRGLTGSSAGACYPYLNTAGMRTYVTDRADTPIPRGVTEFPFVMNLRPDDDPRDFFGRIETEGALHYPANPAVSLRFVADPAASGSCDRRVATDCVVFLDELTAQTVVGGRYASASGTCQAGYERVLLPWLVPGFTDGTVADETGDRFQELCLDAQLPLDTAGDPDLADRNRSLAWGNPVPDGLPRPRTLRMLDGALINQSELFVLFEETFDSFLGDGDPSVTAYGYVLLRRQPGDVSPDDDDGSGVPDAYEGSVPPAITRSPPVQPGAQCDPSLVAAIVPGTDSSTSLSSLADGELLSLVNVLIHGTAPASGTLIDPAVLHYFCEDTGLFDGGPGDDGSGSPVKIACPLGSRVVYFATTRRSQAQIAAERCQSTVSCERTDAGDVCSGGTCQETLNLWRDNGIVEVYEPYFQCSDPTEAYCDPDRRDLRVGKDFFAPLVTLEHPFAPLQAATEAAFRYRTRFVSTTGSRVGFAPQICIPDSDRIPYCYEPAAIEEIRGRVDCLLHVYTDETLMNRLGLAEQTELQRVLKGDFSQFVDPSGDRDGFERLYSELLVMMGDEALTKAFASRFDLAATGGASFQGSIFEPGGIDLSGVAGFEMQSLYQAVEYYQLALDRLYLLGPNMSAAQARGSTDSPLNFLSASTVVLYLDRLIRASTQKAKAFSEIARRYQNFNRPDLARAVIERSYSAAYLESVIVTQLMLELADRSTNADRPQIEVTISQAQRRYRMALLDMRDLFASITDEVNYFGFAPDYIPFPSLDASVRGRSAFEVLIDVADAKTAFARAREDQALASNRGFQTDTATFQAELVRIRNTYEAQLTEVCGSFTSPADGRVYSATRRYAALHPYAVVLGDPCGRMGNGSIHAAMVSHQQALLSQQQLQVRFHNLLEEVEIERGRVAAQCDLTEETARFTYVQAGAVRDLQTEAATIRRTMDSVNRRVTATADLMAAAICIPNLIPVGPTGALIPDPTMCINEGIDGDIRFFGAATVDINTVLGETLIHQRERAIADVERRTARWVTERQCDAALIDSNARTATLLLGLKDLELEALRASHQSRLQLAEIGRLYNDARRRQAEQEETEELLIDVEAARNDPNIRVYRNDAILNADVAFDDALRAAYRATRVFEYYTSQSYPQLEQLFLIRMVGAGDYNLENYLIELRNAFFEFEEIYGSPDTRVAIVSLRDDVLRIPTLDEDGQPLSQSDRIDMMRTRLADVDLLDERGYLTVAFQNSLDELSPLTRNHKILHVEAEIIGSSIGDTVGRVYMRMAGTSVVRRISDDERGYFVFPERTAVVNTFFNGNRVFTPDVYQNARLRDRPLVNTAWEMIINQRDEAVNRDIDLASLSDIRLYVYYTDFTVF